MWGLSRKEMIMKVSLPKISENTELGDVAVFTEDIEVLSREDLIFLSRKAAAEKVCNECLIQPACSKICSTFLECVKEEFSKIKDKEVSRIAAKGLDITKLD
jgi:hypothetical protein